MSKINGFLLTAKDLFESVSQRFTAPVQNEQAQFSLPNDAWQNNLIEQTKSSPGRAAEKQRREKILDRKIVGCQNVARPIAARRFSL